MPKKTKRQKIAAELHKRRMAQERDERNHTPFHIVEEPKKTIHHTPLSSPVSHHKKHVISDSSTNLFKHDLMKSVILCAALITLEVGIYVAQLKGITINSLLPL